MLLGAGDRPPRRRQLPPWLNPRTRPQGAASTGAWSADWAPNPFLAAALVVAIVLLGAMVILFAAASPSIDVAFEGLGVGTACGLLLLALAAFASVFAIVRAWLEWSDSMDPALDTVAYAVRQLALGVWSFLALACLLIAVGTPGGVGVGVPLALFLVFLPGSAVLGGLYLIAGWLGREEPEAPVPVWSESGGPEPEPGESGSWPSNRWWTTLPAPPKRRQAVRPAAAGPTESPTPGPDAVQGAP
jgi:hypothetical protein